MEQTETIGQEQQDLKTSKGYLILVINRQNVVNHQCVNQDGQAEFRVYFSDGSSVPYCAKCVRNSPLEWWRKLGVE